MKKALVIGLIAVVGIAATAGDKLKFWTPYSAQEIIVGTNSVSPSIYLPRFNPTRNAKWTIELRLTGEGGSLSNLACEVSNTGLTNTFLRPLLDDDDDDQAQERMPYIVTLFGTNSGPNETGVEIYEFDPPNAMYMRFVTIADTSNMTLTATVAVP